jgi:hypothetical protein
MLCCDTVSPVRDSQAFALQVAVLHSISVGKHKRSLEPTPLAVVPSANMKGLQLSKRLQKGDVALSEAMGSKPPLVVGTIRMGFGHHRCVTAASAPRVEKCLFSPTLMKKT